MARLDSNPTERLLDLFHVFLVLQTIQHSASHVNALDSHNQAFIQTDKHLTYIAGDNYLSPGVSLEIKPGSPFTDLSLQDDNYFSNNIRLDPPMLDFQEQPVGMPRMENVIVQNNDPRSSLHLLSISGSTVHFHCSFFQDKIVPPGGNTSFDVVFLARQVGNVENTLFIHTSKGSIRYQVFGVGIPNPYRLRPYLGARVPINSSFTPVIQMHNPYSTILQVLEMFASEGDLHLELPSGEKEASKDLWELQPFETKAVMRATFVGRVESNHSAFIRIKTSKEEHKDTPQLLVLPLEIEVSSDPGLYSPVELLDFGILRTLDEPKTLGLNLINTGSKAVHITSVSVSPPNDAISVDFRPSKVQPDSSRTSTVAHISFTASKALRSKQWSGRIIVKTKGNQQRLIIPYHTTVLHGSLVYNANITHFFSGKALWNVSRPMAFTNTFNFSVVIYNVSLPADALQYFTVENFHKPVTIGPQQNLAAFMLKFHPNQTQIRYSTVLTVCTNASVFHIPIIVYNGLMKVIHHRPEKFEGQLDFGTLGVGEKRSMIFTIRNDNPVDIVVARFETNMTWASVEILGMEKGNGTTLTRKHNQSEINIDPLYIKPYHYAVFNVNIIAPDKEGAYVADIWMFTQFQDLFIPIIFRAAIGSLHAIPDKFIFEKVYPGRIPFKVLQIRSTFDDYMEVTQVTFQPADTRFYFVPQNGNTVLLQPHEQNIVGKIYFDAKKHCKEDCYVGLPTASPAGHQWLLGMSLEKSVADTDQYLYTKLRHKWNKLESLQQNMANVTIELDTNQVRGFLFSAQAHLQWPSLVKNFKIKYPLTQIGNMSISDFIVENPGSDPVLIQVLPLSLYPNTQTVVDLLGDRLTPDLPDCDDNQSFVLYDLEPSSQKSDSSSSVLQHRKVVENTLGVTPHRQTLAAVLQPGGKVKVKVAFKPKDDIPRSSLIIIRNNLTIVDAVVVQGEGRRGEMQLSNRRPGSHSALTFEMTEKHLKNCDITERKNSRTNVPPNFTVRRSFTLRNTGDLPFYIHGFSISDSSCEGYGFKVLECSGFEMQPNSSRKVNIAFTPDFTMSQIQRMLTVHTSLGPPADKANYSLQAMVPYDLLSHCTAALPRPEWEPPLYYLVILFMGFLCCISMVSAYCESNKVLADYLRRRSKVANGTQTFGGEKGKIFDLKTYNNLMSNNGGGGSGGSQNSSSSQQHHHQHQHSASQLAGSLSSSSGKAYPSNNHVSNGKAMNGHEEGVNGRDRSGSANSQNNNNDLLHQQHPQSTSTTSTTTNVNGKRKSFLSSLSHFIKSLTQFHIFNSSKKSHQNQHHPAGQEKMTSSSNSDDNSLAQEPPANQGSGNSSQNHDMNSSEQHNNLSAATMLHQHTHEAAMHPEKSIPNGSSITSKSRKGRLNHRRQIVPDNAGDSTVVPSQNSRRSSSSKKDPSLLEFTEKKSSSSVSAMDDFDDTLVAAKTHSSIADNIDGLDDFDLKDISTTHKPVKPRSGKKRFQKWKSESNHEKLALSRDNSLPDEADEVSSTTTESSGGDMEDKTSVCHENGTDITTTLTTDIAASGKKWKKHGGRQSERLVVATHGDEPIDDDSNFEVTSKSKAHRRIRTDKETYGGDIMKPDTYDLPYSMGKDKLEGSSSKKTKRNKKTPRGSSSPALSTLAPNEADSSSDRESPIPDWDQPGLSDPGLNLCLGDLSDLSIQTENFVQRMTRTAPPSSTSSPGQSSAIVNGMGTGVPAFVPSNPPGSPNSIGAIASPLSSIGSGLADRMAPPGGIRGSSYSSIVSSNSIGASSNTTNSEPRSLTTGSGVVGGGSSVSRMMDTMPSSLAQDNSGTTSAGFGAGSRFGSSFGPFSSNDCLPGIVSESLASTNHGTTSSLWNPTLTSTNANTGPINGAYGMSGHQDLNSLSVSGFGGLNTNQGLGSGIYGNNDPNMMYGMYQQNLSDGLSIPQPTMMQQLQIERRRRLWEHQQKVSKGEDWPGFNTPLIRNDSLWDPEYKPPMEHNTWSNSVDSPATPNSGFWSTLTNSASSGWSSLQSLANIWGNNPQQEAANRSPVATGFPPISQPVNPPAQQVTGGSTPFNLYNLSPMADIWSPTSTPGINTSTNQAPTTTSPGGTVAMGTSTQWLPSNSSPPPPPSPPGSGSPGVGKEE